MSSLRPASYSLVSAPVLGFDLVRLPGGGRVASVIGRALTLGPGDLATLAGSALDDRGGARGQAWASAYLAEAASPHLQGLTGPRHPDDATRAAADQPVAAADVAATLRLLERSTIGSLDQLIALVRTDVFDWTWRHGAGGVAVQDDLAGRAVGVVCDAVTAGYLEESLPGEDRRALGGPWTAACRRLPEPVWDLGPQQGEVEAVVSRLRRLTPVDVDRVVAAAAARRTDVTAVLGWSQSVHEATWAVHLSGRLRAAAAAQLAAVEALHDAGVAPGDCARGVWNVASGALQALVVRDVVGGDTAARLIAPYVEALGPPIV